MRFAPGGRSRFPVSRGRSPKRVRVPNDPAAGGTVNGFHFEAPKRVKRNGRLPKLSISRNVGADLTDLVPSNMEVGELLSGPERVGERACSQRHDACTGPN